MTNSSPVPPDGITELLVIQPTSFCNIDCDYCYLPFRSQKHLLSTQTFSKILHNLSSDNIWREKLEILWHSGEPLVRGIDFFEHASEIIQKEIPSGIDVLQTIQTNGMLINDEWCAFFKEHKINLGVSLDGPKALHDAHRKKRNGKGTFDEVMRGVDCLQRNNVPFYIICVLTRDSARSPKTIFDFARRHDFDRLCFNIEETDGINVSQTLVESNMYELMKDFYRHAAMETTVPEKPIWVREIYQMMGGIYASASCPTEQQVNQPFRIITVDTSGNWSTYCPELMSCTDERFGDFRFGNVAESAISDHIHESSFFELKAEVEAGIELCLSSCDYFPVCGGGRPANKFCENGSCSTSETQQCRLTVKALADVCTDDLIKVLL